MSAHHQYILGVDVGSTTIKAKIYDENVNEYATGVAKVSYLHPEVGGVEIEPIALWDSFVQLIKDTLNKCELKASDIKAFGFCCQRSTLLLWKRSTGEPLTNFISWQDTRCSGVVDNINHSWTLKVANILGSVLYFFLRQARFLILKLYIAQCNQLAMKLIWLIRTRPDLADEIRNGNLLFGTIDSWLIWKLTKGAIHATDYTNASSTACYDLFVLQWSSFVALFLGSSITDIAPELCDTSGDLYEVHEDIFGSNISLNAVVGDCQAASFGLCCFNPGQVGCTLGTGCFFEINTGRHPHASIAGLYPQIGCKIKDELSYVCEGSITSMAICIEWAKKIELFNDVSEISSIVKTAGDTDGLYFVPGFGGFRAPYTDPDACAGFIGVKRTTTKAHMLKAILEGMAFIFYDLYKVALDETNVPFSSIIRVCGGVSSNDFLMELISSLTECCIERSLENDMSLLGAVYLAGLGAGIWKDKAEIESFSKETRTFRPDKNQKEFYLPKYGMWRKALKRCMHWYQQ